MRVRRVCRFVLLFCFGGGCYVLLELLWRGYSHWSMFLAGGSCFHLVGKIGSRLCKKSKAVIGGACALAVTAVEYLCGWIVNLQLKLNVWDYSQMKLNWQGQICLLYTVLWGFLSLAVVPVYKTVYGGCTRLLQRLPMAANVRKGTAFTAR